VSPRGWAQRLSELAVRSRIDARKVKADRVYRLRLILSALDQASGAQDMNQPTFRLHPLKGNRKGIWAVVVRANWRVTFCFESGDAYDIDLEDHHLRV